MTNRIPPMTCKRGYSSLWLWIPWLIWAGIFLPLYDGGLIVYADAQRNFIYTNYFLNHLSRGVFPMWNPFLVWGKPDDFAPRLIGELNPLIGTMGILKTAGVPFAACYFGYLIVNFGLGLLGYYRLAARVFNRSAEAYFAFVLLMFTSLGSNLFNDILLFLTFVPLVWFFYFVIGFFRAPNRTDMAGMTFSAMIAVVTYLPVYFLVVLGCTFWGGLIVYGARGLTAAQDATEFIRRNVLWCAFCLGSLALALLPGLWWLLAGASGDYFVSWRSADLSQAASLENVAINAGGLIGTITLRGLWEDVPRIIHTGYFYISALAYVLIGVGVGARLTRRMVFFFLVSFLIFVIGLGDVTPVQPFLYRFCPLFRIIRNLHYFVWLAVPFFVFFLTDIFRQLLDTSHADVRRRRVWAAWITAVHLGWAAFWATLENILPATWPALAVSWLFFTGILLKGTDPRRWPWPACAAVILVLVILQPVNALHALRTNTGVTFDYSRNPLNREQAAPSFLYLRPPRGAVEKGINLMGFGENQDSSGFNLANEGSYVGLSWTQKLFENKDQDWIADYVKYKFVLYDAVQVVNDDESRSCRWKDVRQPAQVVSEGGAGPVETGPQVYPGPAEPVSGESAQFQVTDFDLNFIKMHTDFPRPRFLVYNDSYHKDWRLTINGRGAPLYRANTAFKGFWLPAGPAEIRLEYRPLKERFNIVMIFFFFAWTAGLCRAVYRQDKRAHDSDC